MSLKNTIPKLTALLMFFVLFSVSPVGAQSIEQSASTIVHATEDMSVANAGQVAGASDSLKSNINWLIVIVSLLLILVIGLVFDILETVGKIQGKQMIPWNKVNAVLMLLFVVVGMGLVVWEFIEHAPLTLFEYGSASLHGEEIDYMFYVTLILTGIVFIITQVLLFYFAFRYKKKDGKKALYYPDNHKLEYIWTIVPAIVLTVLVIGGLKAWNKTLGATPPGTPAIEIFAYQFGWTARYPGTDNTFGKHNFRLIGKVNALGVDENDVNAHDDRVATELHLVKGKEIVLKFRAKDVIHSAFLPHFRVQMNCVPGLPTEFRFTPTVTTAEMREKTGNPEFDYIMLCAKICGAAHYRMKMKVVVETQQEYDRWLKNQPKLVADKQDSPAEEEVPETPQDTTNNTITMNSVSQNSDLTLASK